MTAGREGGFELTHWRRLLGLATVYAAAIAYSLFLAGATQGIPAIWTANAVLMAGLMTLDRRHSGLLVLTTSLIHIGLELAIGEPLKFVLTITVLDAIQVCGVVAALKALKIPNRMRSMRVLFVLVATASALTAVSGLLVGGLASMSRGGPFWMGWSDWLTSNVLGVVVIVPTILILFDRRLRLDFPARALETGVYLAATVATCFTVYTITEPLRVLLFAPTLLAVFRGGPRAAVLLVTASLAVAIPTLLYHTGFDPRHALAPLRHAQVFHLVLYTVCLTAALSLCRQTRLKALLERRTAAARAAQVRALAASQAKSDFLATISHEIRTPLNSILGFAALVAQDAELSAENRRRLDLVERAGRSLAEIVNDLLDFAKLESGRLDLSLAPVSPAVLLADAVAIVAPTAAAKGLALTTEVAEHLDETALYALDETRLRQVLLNLLANAVKFTAEGGVTARLSHGPTGELCFEVVDTGIGIAPEVQGRLFQRFSQADSSISRSYGGTGLGLAISRTLIRQMGGDIGVDSTLGQGARFWVRLTAERATSAPPATETALAAEPALERTPQVLLVDDHPMNRELGQALLTLTGCTVSTAQDGAEAVEAARTGGFDLILMDVHMPGMDGLAAARAIRALDGPVAATPIIALSADVLPEQIARCRAAGMDDHVGKPIRQAELLAAITRALTPATEDQRAQSA